MNPVPHGKNASLHQPNDDSTQIAPPWYNPNARNPNKTVAQKRKNVNNHVPFFVIHVNIWAVATAR
jgi:hypothetical protein